MRVLAVKHESFPLTCRHCNPAVGMNACPAGAIRREAQTGAVIIDPAMCMACAMCVEDCPFDAIAFKVTHASPFGHDVAYQCDLCSERVKEGGQPACVEACHSHALVFGRVDEVRSEGSEGGRRVGGGRTPRHAPASPRLG